MTTIDEYDYWDMVENPIILKSFVENVNIIESNNVEEVVDETFVSTSSLFFFLRQLDLVPSFPILFHLL